MRCVVTGASGFLGSHLVHRLVSDGHEVLCVVRTSSDLWRLTDLSDVRYTYASLSNISDTSHDISQFAPEVTFHLAWTGGNSRKYVNDPAQVFENVPGSLVLMRLVADAGCKTVVALGSCVEYGAVRVPVSEADPVIPTNLYGSAKAGTSVLMQGLCDALGVRFCGVRLFWAYGPKDDHLRMIPSVVGKLLAGQRPSLTPGEQLWDFLYVGDAVEALISLATSSNAKGVFNLGSGMPVSIKSVVEQIRDLINPSLELGFGDVGYAEDQIMHLQADVTKLRNATGWSPTTPLKEGLRITVDSQRLVGEQNRSSSKPRSKANV
jgi:UDP-glucose 4-epimerase